MTTISKVDAAAETALNSPMITADKQPDGAAQTPPNRPMNVNDYNDKKYNKQLLIIMKLTIQNRLNGDAI